MLQVTGGLEVEPLKIEVLTKSAYCMVVTKEPDRKSWYYDIMNYIQRQEFPKRSTAVNRKYIMKRQNISNSIQLFVIACNKI